MIYGLLEIALARASLGASRARLSAFEATSPNFRNRIRHNRRLTMEAERPPLPPFTTTESAVLKVRLAEDAWNSRDPVRVSLGYTPDSRWRNRAEFVEGRDQIQAFLTRKWAR